MIKRIESVEYNLDVAVVEYIEQLEAKVRDADLATKLEAHHIETAVKAAEARIAGFLHGKVHALLDELHVMTIYDKIAKLFEGLPVHAQPSVLFAPPNMPAPDPTSSGSSMDQPPEIGAPQVNQPTSASSSTVQTGGPA